MKNKIIKINNSKELSKLYFKMFIYKSFLCKHTNFIINSIYDLKDVEKALNIKNRYQRITYIYDLACLKLDNFYSCKNICEFKNCRCLVQQRNNKYTNGCCRKCKYQSTKGCTTANLTCKLFYCQSVKEKNKTLEINDLNILKLFNLRQIIIVKADYFSKREDVIMDLYLNSLFIVIIRIYYRLIKYYIEKNSKKT